MYKRKLRVVVLTGDNFLKGWDKYFINVLNRDKTLHLKPLCIHTLGCLMPLNIISNPSKLKINRLLKKEKVDIVLNLLYERYDFYFDYVINSFYVHVPYRGIDHPVVYYKPYAGKIINIPLKCYDYHILKRKDTFVFCNSIATYSSWFQFGVPGAVVYYPFNYTKFFAHPNKRDIAVSIGVFSRFKMHETTMKIAKLVGNLKFYILGRLNDLRYFKFLRKKKPSNVTLIPNASEKLKIRLLSKAKFYVHSCPTEGFGVANLEGMASGAVPIVIDSGAFKEIVTHDVGLRWNTPEEAAEAIDFLLKNPAYWQQLSRNALQKAKMFSPEHFEKRIESGFKKMISIYFPEASL